MIAPTRLEAARVYRKLREHDPSRARAIWKWLRECERRVHAELGPDFPRHRFMPNAKILDQANVKW